MLFMDDEVNGCVVYFEIFDNFFIIILFVGKEELYF